MTPTKRILIVDDEPTILLLLEQLLTKEGYEVVTASNGDEANHLSRTRWFDLFLIDLIMPYKDGIETILTLRTLRKNAPIIAMSGGYGGTRICLPLASKLGACATLPKPFDQRTLLKTVRLVMGIVETSTPQLSTADGISSFVRSTNRHLTSNHPTPPPWRGQFGFP